MSKKIKMFLFIFCFCLIVGVVGIFAFLFINRHVDKYAADYSYTDIESIPQADAIMVLGALVHDDGKPSPVLRERLDNAFELYSAGKSDKIILSGDHGTKEYDEVNVMKEYMMDKGVPRENLFLDHAGFNTYDSMYRGKEIFLVDSLLIATQRFHINRAVFIARKLGIEAYGYPVDLWIDYYDKEYGTREKLAKVKAFADITITKREPKFLGKPIPISGCGLETEG